MQYAPLADLVDYDTEIVHKKFGFKNLQKRDINDNSRNPNSQLNPNPLPPNYFSSPQTTFGGKNVECDKIRGNSSNPFSDTPYSGVHVILAINVVIWLLCVFFFALIRRYAFDDEKKLLEAGRTKSEDYDENGENNGRVTRSVSGVSLDLGSRELGSTADYSSTNDLIQVHRDRHIFSFITRTIHLNDTQFQQKCGASAVQYLRFQRFVWYLLFLVTLLSCILILPANLYGTIATDKTSFKRTTIGNLTANSALIWIHTVAAVVFVAIGRQLMKTFRKSTLDAASTSGHTDTSDVLLFSDIPLSEETVTSTYAQEIRKHLEIAYHGCQVEQVQFAFDYEQAIEVHDKITEFEMALKIANSNSEITDFQEGLNREKVKFKESLEDCRRLPVAFVKLTQANRIYRDFNHGLGTPAKSPMYNRLKAEQWTVERCPINDDIFWTGLAKRCGSYYWVRTIAINCTLFIILLFFTTPTIALNNVDRFNWIAKLNATVTPVFPQFSLFTNFLPTLMMWTFSALLPYAVAALSQLEGHWTISGCNLITIQRTFFFLISMVLILPSVGLASFDVVLEHIFKNATPGSVIEEAWSRFDCIFLPDNGTFFVNYVTFSAFIGTGFELLRLPELILYLIRRAMAKTKTEALMLKKERFFEFQYGLQYAWMLTIIATTITYSIVCPLITPIGLCYMTLKHHVDKYNLYYAYKPSRLDRKCHQSAIRYVHFSLFLLVFNVLFFVLLRTDTTNGFLDGLVKRPQAMFLIGIMLCYMVIRCCGRLRFDDNDDLDNNFQDSSKNVFSGSIEQKVYLPKCVRRHLLKTAGQRSHANSPAGGSSMASSTTSIPGDENYERERLLHKFGLFQPTAGSVRPANQDHHTRRADCAGHPGSTSPTTNPQHSPEQHINGTTAPHSTAATS